MSLLPPPIYGQWTFLLADVISFGAAGVRQPAISSDRNYNITTEACVCYQGKGGIIVIIIIITNAVIYHAICLSSAAAVVQCQFGNNSKKRRGREKRNEEPSTDGRTDGQRNADAGRPVEGTQS